MATVKFRRHCLTIDVSNGCHNVFISMIVYYYDTKKGGGRSARRNDEWAYGVERRTAETYGG